jgi:hypothetical protein
MPLRRLSVLAGALVLAVTGTAAAVEDRDLTGPIDPSGTVKVKIRFERMHGALFRTYKFRAKDVPLTCKEAGPITTDDIHGEESIRNDARGRNEFGVGVIASAKRAAYHWVYSGELVRRSKAEGYVRAGGTHWPLEGGGHDECHSGKLPWTAMDGVPVTPPPPARP